MTAIESRFVEVEGLRLHYRECGTGEPVLLLHGWPTSSFLWRHVMGPMGATSRVIALDLPGFGHSDKPADASYSFRFHTRVLDGFLQALGLTTIGLAVHDLGGPIGLYWACQHPERVRRLALLNTVLYPELGWAVVAFTLGCRLPLVRSVLASPWGLRATLRLGVRDPKKLKPEAYAGLQAPFESKAAREALLRAGAGLHPDGLTDIAQKLATFKMPVRVIYGEGDRILPDVAHTMARVKRDLPQAEVTALPSCGHFLQEECGEEVGRLLAEFFGSPRSSLEGGIR